MTFEVKVNDVSGAIERGLRAVEKRGGKFSGDNVKGEFFCKGVQGVYTVGYDGKIEISVQKKTAAASWTPDSVIEKEIRKIFD